MRNVIHYNCVGCGVCCKGRLVPLTLIESEQWLARGDDVAIVLEAFSDLTWPLESEQYSHAAGRSVVVNGPLSKLRVIAVFVGNALDQCPNLRQDNLCGIYEERPLVCRIYPMEINPFIEMSSDNKICPPESWDSGDILCTDGAANPALQALINQSRQADVVEASTKIAICAQLGIKVASWKDNAFAVYFPVRLQLIDAIRRGKESAADDWADGWKVRADDQQLRERLISHNIPLADGGATDYIFHKL